MSLLFSLLVLIVDPVIVCDWYCVMLDSQAQSLMYMYLCMAPVCVHIN